MFYHFHQVFLRNNFVNQENIINFFYIQKYYKIIFTFITTRKLIIYYLFGNIWPLLFT